MALKWGHIKGAIHKSCQIRGVEIGPQRDYIPKLLKDWVISEFAWKVFKDGRKWENECKSFMDTPKMRLMLGGLQKAILNRKKATTKTAIAHNIH